MQDVREAQGLAVVLRDDELAVDEVRPRIEGQVGTAGGVVVAQDGDDGVPRLLEAARGASSP